MKLVEGWRFINEETGEYYPWYTQSFLEELQIWDLSEKIVWEWGCGDSSSWWAKRCKKLYGVDSSEEWVNHVNSKVGDIANVYFISDPSEYVSLIYKQGIKFDIIVIDGIQRDECVVPAIDCIKNNGVLIIDNYLQPSVHVAREEVQNILSQYEHTIYKQEGHYDWQTAIFKIKK